MLPVKKIHKSRIENSDVKHPYHCIPEEYNEREFDLLPDDRIEEHEGSDDCNERESKISPNKVIECFRVLGKFIKSSHGETKGIDSTQWNHQEDTVAALPDGDQGEETAIEEWLSIHCPLPD